MGCLTDWVGKGYLHWVKILRLGGYRLSAKVGGEDVPTISIPEDILAMETVCLLDRDV